MPLLQKHWRGVCGVKNTKALLLGRSGARTRAKVSAFESKTAFRILK